MSALQSYHLDFKLLVVENKWEGNIAACRLSKWDLRLCFIMKYSGVKLIAAKKNEFNLIL